MKEKRPKEICGNILGSRQKEQTLKYFNIFLWKKG